MNEKKPDSIDQRKDTRYDARINVKFKSGNEFASCYSKNISRGGIFIETKQLPDPNATVELVLDLTDSIGDGKKIEVPVTGRVVRLMTINEGGETLHQVAIQFKDISPKVQLQLDQYYQSIS